MPANAPFDPTLESKHLFIEHLAQCLELMDFGRSTLQPTAYRLYARRLSEATAGYPEALLAHRLGDKHPAVANAMANRHFSTHGRFAGYAGERARVQAEALLQRLCAKAQ